jgi:hypothetical protein
MSCSRVQICSGFEKCIASICSDKTYIEEASNRDSAASSYEKSVHIHMNTRPQILEGSNIQIRRRINIFHSKKLSRLPSKAL